MLKGLKGAYIAKLDLNETHLLGVAKKVRSQVEALSQSTGVINLMYPSAGKIFINDEVVFSRSDSSLWRRINHYFYFYLFIIKNLPPVDFIYIRYQGISPIFLYLLSKLKSRNPKLTILLELPSYPYHTEYISLRDKVFGFIDYVSRPFLRNYVDLIVTFSMEKQIFGIPTISTDNGVDVQNIPLTSLPKDKKVLRLLGLANLSFWHGYDRIIAGLAQYYAISRPREVYFDVVGTGREMERLQNDVNRAGLTKYVTFHGSLYGEELARIIDRCHIGISSIGMHRLNVDTSNLKSREFCARGLPFVMAYEDRDFGAEFPFVFHAPANDSPVDIVELLNFRDNLWRAKPNFQKEMRDYAESRLSWKAKMRPVLEGIEKIRSVTR